MKQQKRSCFSKQQPDEEVKNDDTVRSHNDAKQGVRNELPDADGLQLRAPGLDPSDQDRRPLGCDRGRRAGLDRQVRSEQPGEVGP